MRKPYSFHPYLFVSLVCINILASHCKKDKTVEQKTDFGYNYFPDEVNRYIIYEVDSVWQDDLAGVHDTTRYLLKEVIASTFPDNTGRPTLRIERFYKMYNDTVPYDSMNWIGPKVWFANKTVTTAERVEENIRYINLVFPVKKGKQWNGNAYNTLGQKEYELISVDQPETVNNINFDSVITVKQSDNINFIEKMYEAEKYARNIGLIYKERDSIYHGGGEDSTGYTFTQKIISYGK